MTRSGPSRSCGPTVQAVGLALLVFLVYATGACPTIYVGDSGELVTAVHVLGIPHPTGYPLYVLLGKLWTLALPFGSIAWRMSLFSAACGAAACGALYRLCRDLDLRPVAAATAALLLAFSPSLWAEANVQRVYTLNALFVVLATAAACRWQRDGRPLSLTLAFFLCGLGATNHTFMAIYALALGAFVSFTRPRVLLQPRTIGGVVAAFCLGLLPYLYLPLRSRADPPLDWGNPETLNAFLGVVLRRDFWGRAWVEGPADLLPIAGDYLSSLGTELTWLGAALALVGVAASRRRGRPLLLCLLVMLGNVAAMATHGSRSDIFIWHRYYIPSYAMAALLASLGCQAVLEKGAKLPLLKWLPLLIPLFLLVTGWRDFDRSRYRIAEEFSRGVLASLPPGAHLIASDDNILFVLTYLHFVEKQRPDVNLILQGVGDADLAALRFDPDTEPLFFTHHPNWNLPELQIVPRGLVFQAWRAGTPPPPPILPISQLPGAEDPRVPKDYLTRNLIGHFHYMLGFTFENVDWLRARREFAAAAAAAPENDVLFYNLGLIFARNGLLDDAIGAFRRSHEINPRHIASQSRPRADDRIAQLVAEKRRVAGIEHALVAGDSPLQTSAPGTAAYDERLAQLLEGRGEATAARGRRLAALERAGAPPR